MTLPQPREQPGEDLDRLRDMYKALPPRAVRWKTRAGQDFLLALDSAVAAHRTRPVAQALGVTTQAVYSMRERTVNGRARAWPVEADVADLRAALDLVQESGSRQYSVPRTSPRYRDVHEALIEVLDRFPLTDIATVLRVRSRQLARFTALPIDTPPDRPPGRRSD